VVLELVSEPLLRKIVLYPHPGNPYFVSRAVPGDSNLFPIHHITG